MTLAVLASLPLVLVSGLLALRVSALRAAASGIVLALLLIGSAFRDQAGGVLPGLVHWLPTAVEVVVIIGGGITLARVMIVSGAQGVIARWLGTLGGGSVTTVLLVVHGVTPFAESVTGFGVGVLVGVPLLAASGLTPHRAAVLGLLGLCAVPWGALGPGNIVAARLIGETPAAVGIATAWPNVVVTVGVGLAAVLLTPGGRTPRALLAATASGLVLWGAILLSSLFVAMSPSGALGALTAVVAHLAWRRLHGSRIALPRPVRRALAPYALLLTGILASTAATRLLDAWGIADVVTSPALWLVLTCAFALRWFGLDRTTTRELTGETARLWRQTALPTAAYLVLGILMVLGGLTVPLGRAIEASGPLALVVGPAVGAFGGFITGSSTASNSMFAAAQAAVAEGIGVAPLAFVGVQNAAAALLTMASPARVLLAVRCLPAHDVPVEDRATLSRVTGAVLVVDVLLVLALAAWNVLLL